MKPNKPKFIEVGDTLLSVEAITPTCSTGEPQPKTILLFSYKDEEAEPNVHWLTIDKAEELILELERAVREVELESIMTS